MYNSKYYTCEQIDQRLLQGYYDDAIAAGYTGSKAQYLAGLLKAINYADNPTITADKVVYDQTISGLTPKNVQGAIDELENKKIDKTSILQELGDADDKVMSQKVVSDKLNGLNGLIVNPFVYKNKSLSKTLGQYRTDSNYSTSILIPVKNGDIVKFRAFISGSIANAWIFNSDKTPIKFISCSSPEANTIVEKIISDANAAYIQVCVQDGYEDSYFIQVNGEYVDLINKVQTNIDTIKDNQASIKEINKSIFGLSGLIEKYKGVLMNGGTIDYTNLPDSYHTNPIPVKAGDKITYYSRVAYGNNKAGTIELMNEEQKITGHYTPASSIQLPAVYTILDGTYFIVVNAATNDAPLPLINGKSVGLKNNVEALNTTVENLSEKTEELGSESEKYSSIFTIHNKALSRTLGTYRGDTGYSISYPIPCKSGDIFSMSGFVAGAIANAWLLDEELTPIYALIAVMNQITDNKWLNRTIPTVEGHTVAYIIACRRDDIDPDNFFLLNGVPIPYFQYIDYLRDEGFPKDLQLDCDDNGVNTINMVSNKGLLGNKIPIGGLSNKKKYNALGDSVTQASNLSTIHSNDYASLLAKSKGYTYNQDDTNKSNRFWIKIENNKEGKLVEASTNITPIWNDKFGQENNITWGTDGSGNYYRRLYQNAFGGKAAYCECSIACNDVRYYNPDVISVLIGANDASGIDSPNNPYKLGTINDVPVGVSNYYLLDRVYTKTEVASAITNTEDRIIGMRVFFKKDDSSTDNVYYIGNTTEDKDWNNQSNWVYWYQLSFYSFYKGCVINILDNNKSADVVLMNYIKHVKDYGETTIGKVMNAISEVAEYYHTRFVDLTNKSGVNSYNYYAYFNAGELIDGWVDNIHPNKLGHLRMAQRMNQFLP